MRQILATVHQTNPDIVNVATATVISGVGQGGHVPGHQTMDFEPTPHHPPPQQQPQPQPQQQPQQQPWNRYQTGHPHDSSSSGMGLDPSGTGGMIQYEMAVPQPADVGIGPPPAVPQPPLPQNHGLHQQHSIAAPPVAAVGGSSITARPSHRHKPAASHARSQKQQPQLPIVIPPGGDGSILQQQTPVGIGVGVGVGVGVSGGSGRQQPGASWESRFADLALWKAQRGTCVVSQKEDSALARWVSNQRKQKRLLSEGKASSLTEERVEMLESLGFDWGGRGRTGGKTGQRRGWDEVSGNGWSC